MQGKEDWLLHCLKFGLPRKLWNIKHQNFCLQPRWANRDQIYSSTKTTKKKCTQYMKHVLDIRHQAMKESSPWGRASKQGEAWAFGLEREGPGPCEGRRPHTSTLCRESWEPQGRLSKGRELPKGHLEVCRAKEGLIKASLWQGPHLWEGTMWKGRREQTLTTHQARGSAQSHPEWQHSQGTRQGPDKVFVSIARKIISRLNIIVVLANKA
jgi:hypothetical protein